MKNKLTHRISCYLTTEEFKELESFVETFPSTLAQEVLTKIIESVTYVNNWERSLLTNSEKIECLRVLNDSDEVNQEEKAALSAAYTGVV